MANLLATVAPERTGVLQLRFVKCGKPNCHCREGPGHGPYYRLVYRRHKEGVGWVRASKHVAAADVAEVEEMLADARQYTKAAIRAQYRDLKRRNAELESIAKGVICDG